MKTISKIVITGAIVYSLLLTIISHKSEERIVKKQITKQPASTYFKDDAGNCFRVDYVKKVS